MADHIRKQLRAAVLARLTGLATTGPRAFASRVYPLQDSELPAVLVDTEGESVLASSFGIGSSGLLERSLMLEIRCCVKENSTYNDTADQIAKEVEVAIGSDNTFGGIVKWAHLRGVTVEMSGETEKPYAALILSYEALYYTAHGAPDIPR